MLWFSIINVSLIFPYCIWSFLQVKRCALTPGPINSPWPPTVMLGSFQFTHLLRSNFERDQISPFTSPDNHPLPVDCVITPVKILTQLAGGEVYTGITGVIMGRQCFHMCNKTEFDIQMMHEMERNQLDYQSPG